MQQIKIMAIGNDVTKLIIIVDMFYRKERDCGQWADIKAVVRNNPTMLLVGHYVEITKRVRQHKISLSIFLKVAFFNLKAFFKKFKIS